MMRPCLAIVVLLAALLSARADDPPRDEGKTAAEWLRQLTEGDTPARRRAAAMLGWMDEGAKPAIGALTAALRDKDGRVRSTAAYALGRIGPDAKSAASGLAELVKNDEPSVRVCAATALGRVQAPAAIAFAPLVSMVNSDLDYEREVAVEALSTLHPETVLAVDDIIEAARTQSPRCPAYQMLARSGSTSALPPYRASPSGPGL
jgi:HEAT repeat protein